ncbi:MAG: hypothetical protein ACOVQ2_03605 [Flavobacterium sp.]
MAFLYANASEKGLILFNQQNFYVSPNTLVYSKLQVVKIELLQDSICNNYIVFVPKDTLTTNENIEKNSYKIIDLDIKRTIKPKKTAKQKFIHCNNSSNSFFILGLSNKICVVPISNSDFKYITKEILVLLVTQPIQNIQPQFTYKNPTLGLFLQNTNPFYNKPPPIV